MLKKTVRLSMTYTYKELKIVMYKRQLKSGSLCTPTAKR